MRKMIRATRVNFYSGVLVTDRKIKINESENKWKEGSKTY